MADITKCKGDGCPKKGGCYRHTAPEGPWQSYFAAPPFECTDIGEWSCGYFEPVWLIDDREGA